MAVGDWRDASAYEYTKNLSVAGLAWEYLRRNSNYQEAYRQAQLIEDEAERQRASQEVARTWGLAFPS